MIDLKPFCSTEWYRTYLHEPFTEGEYTYATDGHILVRVPKVEGIGPIKRDKPINAEAVLKWQDGEKFHPFSPALPAPEGPTIEECLACAGRGKEHDCPDCECVCEECDGKGQISAEAEISAKISGIDFDLKYLRMIASLPKIEIVNPANLNPMKFRFDGGVGALMPRRAPHKKEVDIS